VRSDSSIVRCVSSAIVTGFCPVIMGASFTGVTVICKPKGALLPTPSLTTTFTVITPVKFAAGVTVFPDTVYPGPG
jgi:hypothetical protein